MARLNFLSSLRPHGKSYRTSKRLNAHLMRTCMLVPERVLTLYILRKVTEEVHNRHYLSWGLT